MPLTTEHHFSRQRFRELRHAADLTVEQLAGRLDRSVWTVIGYEHGRIVPPTDVLLNLAVIFGCSIDDFFAEWPT